MSRRPELDVPSLGEVVTLSHTQFHAVPSLPSGLVYEVSCANSGNGPNTQLNFSGSAGRMQDAALITNCSLHFEDGSNVVGSLIATIRDVSSATVVSDEAVTIGDSAVGSCLSDERTTIMSISGVSVPAKFAASNVTLIVDDTVDIASSSSSGDTSHGLTIYASDKVDIASQHTFISCGEVNEVLVPRGKLIRHVAKL